MYNENVVSIRIYTPAGFSGYVPISIIDGKLPQAVDVDRMLLEAGFLVSLPGVEPGAELETITHVIKGVQTNKDGSMTPIVGLFYENPKLIFPKKAYLNTPEDIATFEKLSGMKLAAFPEFPAANIPKRDDGGAARFMVAVKTPFQIIVKPEPYTDDSGKEQMGTKFAGFYDIGTQPAATTGNATPPKTVNPDFTPPAPASGNGDDKSWRQAVMDLTAFLYNDENMNYNNFEHTASIQKRMNDTSTMGISPDKHTPDGAASVVLAYRATKDLNMTVTEFPQALNGHSLKLFMADYDDTAKGLQAAWAKMVDHAMKKSQPIASNQ